MMGRYDSTTELLLLHVLPSVWINTALLLSLYRAVTVTPGR